MSTGLQIVGASLIIIGTILLSIPASFIIAGTFVILFGIAMERNAK
jgi:hypothetical protein